jgi:hypothetical protein
VKDLLLFLFFLLVLAAGFGCSDDCPVCPSEPHVPDYHLVYSYAGSTADKYVLTYSTKSGQVIDSAYYLDYPFDNVAFTSDGKYACYTYGWNLRLGGSETWVTDAATGDTISYLMGIGGIGLVVSRDDQFLCLSYGNVLAILRIPSLEIVYRDSVPVRGGALHPTKQLAYFIKEPNQDTLFVLDYSLTPPRVTKSMPIRDSQGRNLWCYSGRVFCTDRYLILNPTLFYVTSYLQLYDLDSLTLIRETNTRLYGLYRHPDGKRLFLGYVSYYSDHSPRTGGIDVYNLETNTLYPYYSEDEVNLGEGQPLTPTDIQFTPDGETMYVLSAAGILALGPILEIRTATKEIVRRIDNTDGFSRLIRLNPRDWAE